MNKRRMKRWTKRHVYAPEEASEERGPKGCRKGVKRMSIRPSYLLTELGLEEERNDLVKLHRLLLAVGEAGHVESGDERGAW